MQPAMSLPRLGFAILFVVASSACTSGGGTVTGTGSDAGQEPGFSESGSSSGGSLNGEGTDAGSRTVEVVNVSYANGSDTVVTFALRNGASEKIDEVQSVKVSFGGTQVASFGSLKQCNEWNVLPRFASGVLKLQISTMDTDDGNNTTFITCNGVQVEGSAVGASRPRAAIGSIGKGTVTVTVSGLLADASPFVAKAEGQGQ